MATPQRSGRRDSGVRDKILDATAEIMLEEGYAAATSRRVAEKVGVQRAAVYYYFPSMDDLFLALLRRGTDATLAAQRQALASDRPLQALWELTVDRRGGGLLMEFMALGNHRKDIRAELAVGAEKFREAQVAALTFILRDHPGEPSLPPEVVSVLIAALGRLIVLESAIGITTGHQRTLQLVHQYLRDYDMQPDHPRPGDTDG